MIGIIAASKQEIKELLKRVDISHTEKVGKNRVYIGTLAEREVLVGVSGIGKENAQKYIKALLEKHQITLFISYGFCGGLNPDLRVGDIVIGDKLSCEIGGEIQIQTIGVLGFTAELHSLEYTNKKIQLGTIHHVDHIVEKAIEKAKIRQTTGADAIDMETYYLAIEAKALKIPFYSIRSVSDQFDHDLDVDFKKFISPSNGVSPIKAAWHLITHPRQAYNVNRMQYQSQKAAISLADFLEDFLISKI
jgi:nucleoside phosphorylase